METAVFEGAVVEDVEPRFGIESEAEKAAESEGGYLVVAIV